MTMHIVPRKTYYVVFAVLCVLLVLTVGVAKVDLGRFSPVAAMTIAVAKATLIVLYFMHLRYSSGLTRVFAAAGFVWLLMMLTLIVSDLVPRV